ncbi:polysaccharide lyase family protein [Parapedobacter soli]|uniref:polysaccharide lyase family protein n=1 Tax=Parapedobacter soli TaxID=416955 RepID=UPI0021C7177B|nr:polysaccharide lyase family protein [Parapedobacter soli]
MKKKKYVTSVLVAIMCSMGQFTFGQNHTIWQIGQHDGSPDGMALAPGEYTQFVRHDFGYEDRFFLVGYSSPETDWPYVLPGPANGWGGTGRTAGIRSHVLNAYFIVKDIPRQADCKLVVGILDTEKEAPPLLKVTVNNRSSTHQLTGGSGSDEPIGPFTPAHRQQVTIDLPAGSIKPGYNEITLATLMGGWLVFDNVQLVGPLEASITVPADVLVKQVAAAEYEVMQNGERYQPLLIDVAHLENSPMLTVELDGQAAFSQRIERGEYGFEVPMPRVSDRTTSLYTILRDGEIIDQGEVERSPQPVITPADYVNTMMGTGHSRWMIAPGPWMPFGMVKISPDNQNSGWQSGYDPTFESIGTFSHIHEWTMAGLGTFPVTGVLTTQIGDQSDPDSGYRSRIDKDSEQAPLGYYKVYLTDYNITAELTATTRASLQRYTYHDADTGRIMVDFTIPAEYRYGVEELDVRQVSPYRIEGYSKQLSSGVWSKDADQEYTVHFVMEFDRPMLRAGNWLDGNVESGADMHAAAVDKAGLYVEFDTRQSSSVQVRTGISYVSTENAATNLETEISKPFG